jgi:2-keto-4-pentenoate hydratase/2-oxohepta-3-ene-1,7-dioic acid hydratase in catechol pathway
VPTVIYSSRGVTMTEKARRSFIRNAWGASAAALSTLAAGSVASSAQAAGVESGGKKPVFNVPQVVLPVVGSDELYPIRRIYCIGRNYAAHSREMGSDPTREPPFFFQKPTDAIQYVPIGSVVDHPYPSLTKNYHYEAELVAAIGIGGKNISIERALDHVWGYTLGLDMTRRDLQRALGDEKKPWEIGKSFDFSAPIGPIHKLAKTGHFKEGAIWLKVNGVTKQSANLNQMIWSVAEQISKLSEAFELFPGDIIYSGTPENVGPVVKGDVIEMHIDGLPNLSVKIV